MEEVYKEEYKNCLIKIYTDDLGESPKDWDDENVFLVGYHREFSVDSKTISEKESQALFTGDYNEYGIDKYRYNELKKMFWYFGLEAYIHSGVSLSLSNEGNYPDRQWDVSQLGLVLVSKKESKTEKNARKLAIGLINTWNDYLSGNVYGFNTEDEKNGIDIDSCWGFYGDYNESGIIEEAKGSIDCYLEKQQKEAIKNRRDLSRITLGESLASSNEGIRRNAIGILKQLQKTE